MKLIPASSARWMMRIESSWSVLPHAPNIIVPRQSFETWTPVRPSGRYSMRVLGLMSEVGRLPRGVGRFKVRGFGVGEFQVERGRGVGEVMRFGGADDRGVDDRVLEHPRHRDGRHRDAALLRDAGDDVDDRLVAVEPQGSADVSTDGLACE